MLNNYIAGVTTDEEQMQKIQDEEATWRTCLGTSGTQSTNLRNRTVVGLGSTWQVQPTAASGSDDFDYFVTKPNTQLNRIAINGAIGDKIVNAGKRALPDGC